MTHATNVTQHDPARPSTTQQVPPHLVPVFGDDYERYQRFRDWQFGMAAHPLDNVGLPIAEPVDYGTSAVWSGGRLTDLRHAYGDCSGDGCYCPSSGDWRAAA